MDRAYRVRGTYSFPLDMLRRDVARPATEADQVLITKFSGEFSIDLRKPVDINLIMESGAPTRARPGGRYLPNIERWESFGWTVHGVPEIDQQRATEARIVEDNATRKALRTSGLAKLTPQEREALGL